MAMSCAAGGTGQARGWPVAGVDGMGMAKEEQRGLGAGGCRRWRPPASLHRPAPLHSGCVVCVCVYVCGANYNTAYVLFAAKVKAHELRGQSKSELQQQVRRAAAAAGRLWRAGSGGRSSGSSSTRCPSLQAPAAAPVSGIRAAHDQSRGRSMGRRASAQQTVAPRQHAPVARFPSVLTARCTPPTCPALLPACSSRT
jgi:hypothetical protein